MLANLKEDGQTTDMVDALQPGSEVEAQREAELAELATSAEHLVSLLGPSAHGEVFTLTLRDGDELNCDDYFQLTTEVDTNSEGTPLTRFFLEQTGWYSWIEDDDEEDDEIDDDEEVEDFVTVKSTLLTRQSGTDQFTLRSGKNDLSRTIGAIRDRHQLVAMVACLIDQGRLVVHQTLSNLSYMEWIAYRNMQDKRYEAYLAERHA